MASLRSSARTTPRKRYTVDAFDGIQDLLVEPNPSSSENDDEDERQEVQDDEDDGDEFQAEAAPSEPEDESMSTLDEMAAVEDVDDRASNAGEADLDDSMSIVEDEEPSMRTPHLHKKRTRTRPVLPPEEERTYVRGVPNDLHQHLSKENRRKWLFGPVAEDQVTVFEARNRWSNDLGLPKRKSGRGVFAYSSTYRKELDNAESNWKWYSEDGGQYLFEQQQVVKALTVSEAQTYLPTDFDMRTFVMGPLSQRQLYSMKARQWVSISGAHNGETHRSRDRKGFILNLGAKVQSLDWAPSQDGPKQYLAAAVLPKNRREHPSFEAPLAPSFTSQTPHRSSIQIWEIDATANNYIDDTTPPKLRVLLCTAIGDIKSIKWCPVPRTVSERLGLLACVSGDGAIRIYDVPRPTSDSRAMNILLEKAAFDCRPPNTVCTSLTWISSSRIAAACANGFVAVWDVEKSIKSGLKNPRPDIYTDISTTYIVNITSYYPSYPNLIATSSMSGYMMLTDLTRPRPSSRAATGSTSRTRIGQPLLVWHDFAHSGVSVEDNMTIRCYPLRRWFRGIGTGKLRGHGTSIAVSTCHPYVLIGSAAGEVTGHNPLRRMVDGGRNSLIQQRWFTHEWRRPTEDETDAADADAEDDDSNEVDVQSLIGKDGLSRITDGYKPNIAFLNNSSYSASNVKDGTLFSTIYEEKSAVTALAWNPNIHVGGWAAAGMADGLLRIEDIAT